MKGDEVLPAADPPLRLLGLSGMENYRPWLDRMLRALDLCEPRGILQFLTLSSPGAAARDKLLLEGFLGGGKLETCAELCFGLSEGRVRAVSLLIPTLSVSTVSAFHGHCATKARAPSPAALLSWL